MLLNRRVLPSTQPRHLHQLINAQPLAITITKISIPAFKSPRTQLYLERLPLVTIRCLNLMAPMRTSPRVLDLLPPVRPAISLQSVNEESIQIGGQGKLIST